MFFDQFDEVCRVFLAVEYLSLSELNIFLQVIGRGFRNTEIFHCFRHFDPHLLAHPEIMVNGIARRKYDRGKLLEVYLILPEILGRDSFYSKKLPECDVDVELSGYLTIW